MTESPRPRRAAVDHADLPEFDETDPLAPRRGVASASGTDPAGGDRRQWVVVGVIGFLMAIMVGVLYLVFGSDHPTAGPTDAPEPASTSPSASATTSPSPTATPSPPGVREVVGDTEVTIPAHWQLYADEITEGDRRLVRAMDTASDVRIQVATLTTVGTDLETACQALIADQGSGYDVDFQFMPRYVTVDGDATALSCGFVGTREGDDAATNVLFTMVQRRSDLHTLVLRVMRPQALPPGHDAVREVAVMNCEATTNFGSPLPLCPQSP